MANGEHPRSLFATHHSPFLRGDDMGRHVLLTGAAGGIGQGMTAGLLADGHSVAAIDRDAAALERLVARTADARARLHPIVADLQSERGCETAVEAATARFGAV